jgi:hypothetical protein
VDDARLGSSLVLLLVCVGEWWRDVLDEPSEDGIALILDRRVGRGGGAIEDDILIKEVRCSVHPCVEGIEFLVLHGLEPNVCEGHLLARGQCVCELLTVPRGRPGYSNTHTSQWDITIQMYEY